MGLSTSFEGLTDSLANVLGEWSASVNVWSVLFRLLIVIIFTSLIGCERASKRHAAGFRTFVLVGIGCCLAGIMDAIICEQCNSYFFVLSVACIIGISIMTTNTIIYSSRSQIKGLTTSVALWCTATLGLCCGLGLYTLSIIAFLFIAFTLSVLPGLEVYLKNRSNHFEIHLELKSAASLKDFTKTIRELGITIDDIEQNGAYNATGLSVYSISVSIHSNELKKYKTHKEIIEALSTLEYVSYIEEMN